MSGEGISLAEALQRAVGLHRDGDLEAAERAYRVILDAAEVPDAQHLLGVVLHQQGRSAEASLAFQAALAARPDQPLFLYNQARALSDLRRYDDCAAALERAVALKPDFVEAWRNLGTCHRDAGNPEASVGAFRELFRLTRQALPSDRSNKTWRRITRSKLRHDIEQLDWLEGEGELPAALAGAREAYRAVLDELDHGQPDDDDPVLELTDAQFERIGRWFNRALHVPDLSFDSDPVNPQLDVEGALARWRDNAPGISWFDDFLVPEARHALYRWMLASTLWFDCGYQGGYLGAYVEEGFACAGLLQIAASLQRRFPTLMADHPLRQMWAFKCDPRLRGLGAHADSSVVNVNFWVTPDEANLDAACGGLVVTPVVAPPEWGYDAYNSAEHSQRIHETVRSQAAEPIAVPYRCNRAVMFNSDLFHWSDRIHFRDGYEHRRINVTMLFGARPGS